MPRTASHGGDHLAWPGACVGGGAYAGVERRHGDHTTMSEPSAEAGTTITVIGVGRIAIRPDVADIRVGTTLSAETAAAARDAVARIMAAVLRAVRSLGIEDSDLQTSSLMVTPRTDYRTGTARVTGYEATNAVSVVVRDLETLGALVDQAVTAGATTIDGPSFRLSDPAEATTAARRLAVEDAADRAATLAAAAGLRIVGVASMGEGGVRPMPLPRAARMMAVAEASPSPVEIGSDEVRVQVEVVYLADQPVARG